MFAIRARRKVRNNIISSSYLKKNDNRKKTPAIWPLLPACLTLQKVYSSEWLPVHGGLEFSQFVIV